MSNKQNEIINEAKQDGHIMEKTVKHTAGPWEVSPYRTSLSKGILIWDGKKIPVSVLDKETKEEDARLIAAAPELLEALKDMVLWFESRKDCKADTQYELITNANNAIKLAQGGQ